MSTINGAVTRNGDQSVVTVTFTAVGDADSGAPIQLSEYADRSVQATGTWDSATLVWQGSNDGTTWFTLNDPDGNAISKTANFLESVMELTKYARPTTSGGQGSTDIDVVVTCRRQSSIRT
jgi:hypothetical protein